MTDGLPIALRRPHQRGAGRARRFALDLLRRLLPERAQPDSGVRDRRRAAVQGLQGDQDQARVHRGDEEDAHRRARRASRWRSSTAGRSATACRIGTSIWTTKEGSSTWSSTSSARSTRRRTAPASRPSTSTTTISTRTARSASGVVHYYLVGIDDPRQATRDLASTIDAHVRELDRTKRARRPSRRWRRCS